MILKKKSLIVALVSSIVIAAVLVPTFISYVIYIEIKGEEARRTYQDLLQKINAKVYSKYIEISNLDAKIESSGVLKGKPVMVGIVKNKGARDISNLLIKVNFLDTDGAIMYDVIFHPQEPSLGSSALTQISIPYLSIQPKIVLRPGKDLPFKKILFSCPDEIIGELQDGRGFAKGGSRWSGKFTSDVLAIDFP